MGGGSVGDGKLHLAMDGWMDGWRSWLFWVPRGTDVEAAVVDFSGRQGRGGAVRGRLVVLQPWIISRARIDSQ